MRIPFFSRRLKLVQLEDRVAPAMFTVNSLLDTATPPAGTTTLRSAITAANADNNSDPAHPDVIGFTVTGTIALAADLPAISGCLSIQGPGVAGLTVLGPTAANPNIQSGVIGIVSSGSATISGLTVDGNAANPCVFVDDYGSVALQADFIQHGNGYVGGGISTILGNVTVTDSTITANNGQLSGGGIYTGGNLTITRATISNNSTPGDGGGIDIFHGLTTTTLTVTASTFSGNFASGHGGAINLADGVVAGNVLTATVADSTFAGNAAFYGGALSVYNRFSTNTIKLSVAASTITRNVDANYGTGAFGGGVYVNSGAGPVRLFDSILAGNGEGSVNNQFQITSNNSADDVAGLLDPSGADNLIGAPVNPTGLMNGANGNQIGNPAVPINPLLGALQDNGGPTQTALPLPGSPALDRGGPDPVLAGLGVSTDQRGRPRVSPLGFTTPPAYSDGRDIGAVEGQITTLTVNTATDLAAPPAGSLTLRQALQVTDGQLPLSAVSPAQVVAGDLGFYQIEFTLPTASTISLSSVLPTITADVAIQDPPTAALTVLGDGQHDALLTVSPGTETALLSGLILDGNNQTNSGISVGAAASVLVQDAVFQHTNSSTNGGGIFNQGGTVSVLRAQFLYDSANGSGGAIASVGGSLDVRQSTFGSNVGNGGAGAIYNMADNAGGGGALFVLDSTFTNNLTSGRGGAISLDPGSHSTVIDSTFAGNFAPNGGGAIGVYGLSTILSIPSFLMLSGSTLFGNLTRAVSVGGGLYVQSTATAVLRDTIVAGNTTLTGTPTDVSGGLDPASAYDLVGVGSSLTGISNSVNGNLIGTSAAPIDPRLGALASNGGLTQTLVLLPGSPAIDHGAADTLADGLTANDQAGNPRVVMQPFATPAPGRDGRDIGAYELPAQSTPTTLTVNSLADANPPTGVLTLRQALQAADGLTALNTLPAGQVSVGSPYWFQVPVVVSGTIRLSSALPAVTTAAFIQGPGAAALTLQGDGTTVRSVTVFNGGSGYTSPPQVTFSSAPPGGTTATGVAVVQNGQVVSVTITNSGFGYAAPPIITFGGPGTGAAANANPAADPLLTIAVGATADVSGLTLDGNQGFNEGISVGAGATLLVQDAIVQRAANNGNGGGILSQGGNVSVARSQFLNDVAGGGGGAIASIGGNLNVRESTFSSSFASGSGGGIYNAANSAGGGGTLNVQDSTFTNNQTVGRGGALDLEPGSQASVADSTFYNNYAANGGGAIGVYGQSANLNLTSSLLLTSSTIFGNQVGAGASGAGLYVQGTATALVRDTIVAGNQHFNGPVTDVSGALDPASDHDLIGDGTSLTGIGNGLNGNLIGTAAGPIDPKLGPLASNGGPTQTFALLAGSPAIDAGSGEATTATDQRGVPQITFANIGAYQATAAALVLTGLPPSATAGTPTSLTVAAVDKFGQPALGYRGSVTFTSTDALAALPMAYAFTAVDNGAHAFAVTLSTPGSQSITVADRAGGFTSTSNAILVAAAAPQVLSVVVNEGSAQRSEVRSIAVTFSGPVTFAGGNGNAAAAFQLTHLTDFNNVVLSAAVVTDDQSRTVVTLTFAGSETDPVSARNGGVASLADGRYSLTIFSAAVSGSNGQSLGGGGPNGNYVSPPDSLGGGAGELHLFRLFGDVNGDGVVDQTDLGQFRSAFNSAAGNSLYLSYLDADNSGSVDQVDLGQLRSRFNANVF
jgi:hypothetical protein